MSDSAKETVIHKEAVEAPLPVQKKGFKRHCARFWWIHLIVFIIITIVVVVITIFVAVPKIAQQKLDDATLTIEGIIVSNAQSGSLTMSINSTIYADDSVHATIEGFRGVMYLEDLPEHKPFARIDFPETYTKKVQTVNVTQDLEIDDMDALTTFNTWLITNETVRVTVEGKTKVHVKGLTRVYDVTFKKTLDIPALNNFSGLEVLSASISAELDENGENFRGFTNIPNHSIFTLEIGDASFSTSFEGKNLGVTMLDNMMLYPGDNNITMHANMEQGPVISALLLKPYCEGAEFPIDLTGLNVTNNGQNITYYGEALAKTTQTVHVPIGEILARDLNLKMKCAV